MVWDALVAFHKRFSNMTVCVPRWWVCLPHLFSQRTCMFLCLGDESVSGASFTADKSSAYSHRGHVWRHPAGCVGAASKCGWTHGRCRWWTHTHTHTHTPANRTLLYSKTMTDFRKLFQVEHSFYTFRQRHSTHKHSIHCIIKITHANTYSLESSGIWGNLSLWMSLLIWLFGGVTRTVRIYPVHLKCNVKRQHFCCEVQSHYITIAVFPPNNWHPQPSSHSNSFW